jgi:adenine/guanine phosphoribosyltransferase-like PRPP-binding protein
MDQCVCELSGFCEVRNIALKPTLQTLCKRDKARIDAMLAGVPPEPKATTGPQRKSCSTSKRGKCSDRSNAGTLMMEAIQADTGQPVSCGSCKAYLLSLNRMSSYDHAAIVQKLYAEISWPPSWRAKHGDKDGQRARISEIVSGVLATATTTTTSCKVVRPSRSHRPVARARTSNRGAFRQGSGPVRFVRSSQFQFDILNLIAKIPPDITAIAGVARSGLSAATMLSMYLHLPMVTIRQTMNDVIQTGNGWRLGGSKHVNPRTEKILVVDDTVMTGNSLKAIAPLIDREFGNAIYAAIYVNPAATRKPDIWSVDLPWPHILEWNVFNSILSPFTAMDFDGILCHDCPPGSDDDGPKYLDFIRNAPPLYMPRRCPVPLIVTARIEKYRAETEAWLRRHGIAWHRLVMHPAATLRERQRDNIAAHKAHHYAAWAKHFVARPGPHIFFESEDRQAREIAQLSKLLTICPHSAGCY